MHPYASALHADVNMASQVLQASTEDQPNTTAAD